MTPVSIIGIGCRVPGASGPHQFWRLLREGRDATAAPPPGRSGTRRAGYLDRVDAFDSEWFGITDREAAAMDPQQRLALEVAVEAIDDAGIGYRVRGSDTAVVFGATSYDHGAVVVGRGGGDAPYALTGSALSIIANRLSYVLDLHGPSLVLDSACSASLAAVDLALRLLADGSTGLAIVGGVHLTLLPHPTNYLDTAGFLAPDGRCKPFDAAADGYTRAEGCTVLVLQRTADAHREGNRAYAEILGAAVGSDGRSNGLYAPSGTAQQQVIRAAWQRAGADPAAAGYFECHGTGTPLGDAVEVGALAAVLGDRPPDATPIRIGSVKSNLGHLEAAAGVTGLAKAALSIHHGTVVPSINFRQPNPLLRLSERGLTVPATPLDWTAPPAERYAGVSSFGFGGTNAHAVLRGVPERAVRDTDPPVLIPVSGRDETELRTLAARWATILAESGTPLREFAAAAGRLLPQPVRAAIRAADREEAVTLLRALAATPVLPPDTPVAERLLLSDNSPHPGQATEESDATAAPRFESVESPVVFGSAATTEQSASTAAGPDDAHTGEAPADPHVVTSALLSGDERPATERPPARPANSGDPSRGISVPTAGTPSPIGLRHPLPGVRVTPPGPGDSRGAASGRVADLGGHTADPSNSVAAPAPTSGPRTQAGPASSGSGVAIAESPASPTSAETDEQVRSAPDTGTTSAVRHRTDGPAHASDHLATSNSFVPDGRPPHSTKGFGSSGDASTTERAEHDRNHSPGTTVPVAGTATDRRADETSPDATGTDAPPNSRQRLDAPARLRANTTAPANEPLAGAEPPAPELATDNEFHGTAHDHSTDPATGTATPDDRPDSGRGARQETAAPRAVAHSGETSDGPAADGPGTASAGPADGSIGATRHPSAAVADVTMRRTASKRPGGNDVDTDLPETITERPEPGTAAGTDTSGPPPRVSGMSGRTVEQSAAPENTGGSTEARRSGNGPLAGTVAEVPADGTERRDEPRRAVVPPGGSEVAAPENADSGSADRRHGGRAAAGSSTEARDDSAERPDEPRRAPVPPGGFEVAESGAAGDAAGVVIGPGRVRRPGRVLFLFSGQGGQHARMGRALAARYPVFARAVAEATDAVVRAGGPRVWTPRYGFAQRPAGTAGVQPALFVYQVALAELLRAWGIHPDAVAGHSLGEIAAAVVCGGLSLDDGARVVVARSTVLARLDGRGAMAVLEATPYEAARLVEPLRSQVAVAAINGPRAVVVSGAARWVETVVRRAQRRQMFARYIAVDFAAHSPQVRALATELSGALTGLRPGTPRVPLLSTARRGEKFTGALDSGYWVDNACGTVELAAALETAVAEDISTVIELGPHPVLAPAVRDRPEFARSTVTVADRDAEASAFLDGIGRLFVAGGSPDWSAAGACTGPAPQRIWRHRSFPPRTAAEPVPLLDDPAPLHDHVVDGVPTVPVTWWLRQLFRLGPETGSRIVDFTVHERTEVAALDEVRYRETGGLLEALGPVPLASGRSAPAPLPGEIVGWMRAVDAHRGDRRALRSIDLDAFYTALRERRLEYGPGFRTLRAVVAGSRSAIGFFGQVRFDAAVLDGCLQVIAAAALPLLPDGVLPLPVGIASVWLAGAPDLLLTEAHAFVRAAGPTGLVCEVIALDQYGAPAAALSGIRIGFAALPGVAVAASAPAGPPDPGDGRVGGLDLLLAPTVPVIRPRRADPPAAVLRHEAWLPARAADWAAAQPLSHVERVLIVGESALAVRLTRALHRRLAAERIAREPGAAGPIVSSMLATRADRTAVVLVWPDGAAAPAEVAPAAVVRALELLQRVYDDEATTALTVVLRDRAAVEQQAVAGLVRSVQTESGRPIRLVWAAGDKPGPLPDLILDPAGPEEVRVDGDAIDVRRFVPAPGAGESVLRPEGTYVVTGGLGALGAATVRWLLAAGAHDVVVLTRTPRPLPPLLDGLEDRIVVVRCDVADRADLANALDDIRECGSTIRGLVHAAGVLRDAEFSAVTGESLLAVFAPKLLAAADLLDLTAADPIDFALLYSSATGALGAPGQAAYAAANAALDALARGRTDRRVISIAWGSWDSGLAATAGGADHLRRAGVVPFDAARGAAVLPAVLAQREPFVLALDYSPSADRSPLAERIRTALGYPPGPHRENGSDPARPALPPMDSILAPLVPARRGGTPAADTGAHTAAASAAGRPEPGDEELPDGTPAGGRALRSVGRPTGETHRGAPATGPDGHAELTLAIRSALAETLDRRIDSIDPETDFVALGLTSLLAIELRRALEARLGRRLGTAELFEFPTVAALAAHLSIRQARQEFP
ncbi:type I polyketide synthase [Nocardia sp. alder85J]|uniref:type I polyketide synthase n=1 Tax=Nocardia sp. alder85J TaxID=2862949 RepID=UPI002253F471|nr:type I polyketide synthase [Nocardia sp. alder85J]MCX4096426.1 SDR family NAD(P)-dependent oxidoreductase [Nocardia sp. alder85J]